MTILVHQTKIKSVNVVWIYYKYD